MEKRIEVCRVRVGDLRLDFGNPRKIKKQKREDLEDSLEKYGNFGEIVVNEENQVLGGNQRVEIYQRKNPDMEVDVKRLIGYTIAEQKYVNIKLNSHAGEWDLEELGDWTADLMGSFKLDLETPRNRWRIGLSKRWSRSTMNSTTMSSSPAGMSWTTTNWCGNSELRAAR